LTTFFDTGEVDDSRFTYQPMDFNVGLGFPTMAKIIVGVILLLIVVLVILVRYIIKKKFGRIS
jgi:hypothetical protein